MTNVLLHINKETIGVGNSQIKNNHTMVIIITEAITLKLSKYCTLNRYDGGT